MVTTTVTWRDVCFVHWPVRPGAVDPLLPPELSVDTRRGRAWIGAVPFRMSGPRITDDTRSPGTDDTDPSRSGGIPSSLAGGLRRVSPGRSGGPVPEVNFRTYVTHGDRTGTYFFSLDAADPGVVALSRRLFGLPFYRAEARLVTGGDRARFFARRTDDRGPPARFLTRWRPLPGTVPDEPPPGSREAFLIGRRGYFTSRGGRLQYGTVEREPFRVRPAAVDVESNSLFRAAGLPEPTGDPLGLVAEGETEVAVGDLDPVEPS